MKMHDIEVFLNENNEISICQVQEICGSYEQLAITITKDQAKLVSQWILEAAKEE